MNIYVYDLNWPVVSQEELLGRPLGIGWTANTKSIDSPQKHVNDFTKEPSI
jgi:hypothetical protein